MASKSNSLEQTLAASLANRKAHSRFRRLTSFPPDHVDFSSNSYLSLSIIPEVRQELLKFLKAYESSTPRPLPLFGSGGSRLLDGNLPLAESLEADIARFHGAPSGLLFNSGFDANVGLFSCLPQPGDVIVYDELIHASAHDGMKMSRAGRKVAFRHNCVTENEDDTRDNNKLKSLDAVLKELANEERASAVGRGENSVFIAVEGVYSMDGDLAPLSEIVSCVNRRLPRGNGYIIVDEAHSTGLFGKEGRGLVCELGLEDSVFVRLHTFGKAMSASGAIVLCSSVTRDYLINYARTLIYTTAMSALTLASIQVSYDFLASGRAEGLRNRLNDHIKHAHKLLLNVARPEVPAELFRLNPDEPKSPIIPILTSLPRSLAKFCQDRKFVVRPVVAPTVPKGSERVRICIHAANTSEEIEGLARIMDEWVQSQLLSYRSIEAQEKPRL